MPFSEPLAEVRGESGQSPCAILTWEKSGKIRLLSACFPSLTIQMDNNTVERSQRGPVVGRKNYYGSGAVWAGRLASMMFSLLQTLSLWNLNARAWLTSYSEASDKAPESLAAFLPWQLGAEDCCLWSLSGEGA